MANNTAGGAGALLSGLAGGYSSGRQLLGNTPNPSPTGLGLPGQSATGAQGLPQTQPAAPSTPDAKAATTATNGNWGTLAGYFNQG